jgi:hypothetical protein
MSMTAVEPASGQDQGEPWVLALVPLAGWTIIDAVRRAGRRPSRSTVAEDAIRRALSKDAEGTW